MENNERPIPTRKTGETRKVVAVSSKKNKSASTIAIVTLSILLGLSLILGLTAAFFNATQTATGTITLGNPVNVSITQGGATVESLTFSGDAMPGTSYTQPIGVTIPANTSECVLRAKLTLTNTGSAAQNVAATTSESWVLGEDGYHYYNGTATAGNSISFCSAITVPKTLENADAGKTFTVSFQVEAIQFANGAASEVWTTAPESWVTNYGSGTRV